MKAKRIVSILLTGSMLLSLLPVSALAATPVFDAPAQTTAKKAAPLVQEADASRSTEEEAATRSSRDLDAENSTSDSFTIDLNAGGMPESEGDYDHWFYSANSTTLFLYDGTFTLQPSSDPEAASALQADLDIREGVEFNGGTVGDYTYNNGTISGGIFQREVFNYGIIYDGTFQGEVYNNDGTISGGTFQGESYNFRGTISNGTFQGILHNDSGTISGGTFKEAVEVNAASGTEATIEGGTFEKRVTLKRSDTPITISNGLFNGEVVAEECYAPLSITGGYFVNKPIVPEGSDTRFTTVSDQNDGNFQVPVNDGFSESYTSLYVPSGSSEQPNTITVKTNTKLLYYLADDERVPVLDSDSDSYIYEIPVRGYEKVVLVTEEPSTPPPGGSDSELDPAFSSGAAALGIVLGTAGLGYATYVCGSSLYLHYVLPGGFIPSTRQELATVLWTTAGKSNPVSTALYTDIPADAIEQQKAARWCAEQGLLSDHGATFGPDTKVTNARIIRAWNSLKKVPVTITK